MSHVKKNCDRFRTFALKGIQSLLNCMSIWEITDISSIWFGGIETFWNIWRLGWVQNLWFQNLLILLVSNIQLEGYQDMFSPKNHTRKINKIYKDFFNYIKSLYINYIFCAKMFGYSKIIYYLQVESTYFVTKDFELNQVFICLKMSRYAQVIYYCTH